MVERLIQTLKRRLAATNLDTKWSKETLASKISAIIENVKLILNTTTKITPFEAHFGRKPNAQTSNMVTHQNKNYVTYNNIKKFYLEKKILRRPTLNQQAMWNFSTRNQIWKYKTIRQKTQTRNRTQFPKQGKDILNVSKYHRIR